jgi:hypothetical protein
LKCQIKKDCDGIFVYDTDGFRIQHNCDDFIFYIDTFKSMQILEYLTMEETDSGRSFDFDSEENHQGKRPYNLIALVKDYVFMFKCGDLLNFNFWFCHKDYFSNQVRDMFMGEDFSLTSFRRLRNPNEELENVTNFGLNCQSFLNEPCFNTWQRRWIYPENPNKVEIFKGKIKPSIKTRKQILNGIMPTDIYDIINVPQMLFITTYDTNLYSKFSSGFDLQKEIIIELSKNKNNCKDKLSLYLKEVNELREVFGMVKFDYSKDVICSLKEIEEFKGDIRKGFPNIEEFMNQGGA